MKLSEAIEIYVRRKRNNGILFDCGSKMLRTFCNQIGDSSLGEVKTQYIAAFLNRHQPTVTSWRINHSLLRKFFEYWAARDAIAPLLMPPNRQPVQQSFVAHIYTQEEIRRLIRAIPKCQSDRSSLLDKRTVRCAILLLYGTGARVGEIAGLRVCDVDAKRGYISIWGDRFGRSRKIPIGPDLRAVLNYYLGFRQQKHPTNDRLFVTRDGRPATASHLRYRFKRLRVLAGIQSRNCTRGEPRMRDLRPSFAVHRIASWIKCGADLNRMLPALAAYMGLVGLTATERYLALTPERFCKELSKLSPERAKRHWRDDPQLMKFLAAL
jgi:integrase/recombinase XerD